MSMICFRSAMQRKCIHMAAPKRSYTDYHGMKYPELRLYSVVWPAIWFSMWLFFMRCGHVNSFTGRNEWKYHVCDHLNRFKGVMKPEDVVTVESYFTNLPDRAE